MIVSRLSEQVNLRLPGGMRQAIAARAAENGRSMNSEVIKIFECALRSATAATGGMVGADTPAAAQNDTALAGGPINTHA
jgi:plasmid stability protein